MKKTKNEITPIEKHGGYLVKRDDLFAVAGVCGGKARACLHLARQAKQQGKEGLITACNIRSPQAGIVAHVAKKLDLKCHVFVNKHKHSTAELDFARQADAEITRAKSTYDNQAEREAANFHEEHSARWAMIPFGMQCQEAVDFTAAQTANIPKEVGRIVVPVGSGITLAGVLKGLHEKGLKTRVLGVWVGRKPEANLDKYAPEGWSKMCELVESELEYKDFAPDVMLGGLRLDEIYEAKCLPYLKRGDLFWVVGIRQTATGSQSQVENRGLRKSILIPESATVKHFADMVGDEKKQAVFLYTTMEISKLLRKGKEFEWQIGRHLLKVRKILPHGQFGPYHARVLDLSRSTVSRYKRLAEKYETPKDIPQHSTWRKLDREIRRRFVQRDGDDVPFSAFSVLDATTGPWKQRKQEWLDLGIDDTKGRPDSEAYRKGMRDPSDDGVSAFDPVLAEVMYKWFCPEWGAVLDPFAGGMTRGIVAGACNRQYIGWDIREDQLDMNQEQWEDIVWPRLEELREQEGRMYIQPLWVSGESQGMNESHHYDFVLTCPPYFNLERYGGGAADLSSMTPDEFLADYRLIIDRALKLLAEDRFAAYVVADVRDKKTGFYQRLVSETENAFEDCGARLYNKFVLMTAVGSLPKRTPKQWEASRKAGQRHQEVLVFVKGDPKKATAGVKNLEQRPVPFFLEDGDDYYKPIIKDKPPLV